MSSTEYSAATLTEQEAEKIANAYVKGERDPLRICRILGVPSLDMNLVMHPLVRNFIVQMERTARISCTMDDHMEQLVKIRDAAFDDENWKVALAAETQRGKAAGHYDPKPAGDDGEGVIDPTKMPIEELRRRVAGMVGAVIPERTLPAPEPEPGSLEGQEADSDEI
jgi:hypothetical protein